MICLWNLQHAARVSGTSSQALILRKQGCGLADREARCALEYRIHALPGPEGPFMTVACFSAKNLHDLVLLLIKLDLSIKLAGYMWGGGYLSAVQIRKLRSHDLGRFPRRQV